jgi:hypothetical protein
MDKLIEEDLDPYSFPKWEQLQQQQTSQNQQSQSQVQPNTNDISMQPSTSPSPSPPTSTSTTTPPIPQDALDIQNLLKSHNIDYEPNIVHQCLEFIHRYIKEILEDANEYKLHAGRTKMGKTKYLMFFILFFLFIEINENINYIFNFFFW